MIAHNGLTKGEKGTIPKEDIDRFYVSKNKPSRSISLLVFFLPLFILYTQLVSRSCMPTINIKPATTAVVS